MAQPQTLSFGGNPAAGIAPSTYNTQTGQQVATDPNAGQFNTSPQGQAGVNTPNVPPPSAPNPVNGGNQPPNPNPPTSLPSTGINTPSSNLSGGNATGSNFSSASISGTTPPNLYDLYHQELANRGVYTANKEELDINNQIAQDQQILAPLGLSHTQIPSSLSQLVTGGANQSQLDLQAAQAAAPIQMAMSFLIQSRSNLSTFISQQSALAQQAVTNAQTEYQDKLTASGYVGQPQIISDQLGNKYAVLTKPDGTKEIDPVVDNQGNVNNNFNSSGGQTNTTSPTTPDNGGNPTGSLISSNPNPNSNIGGYDFTNFNASGGANIASVYNSMPTIGTAQDAQAYINKVAPNSPITGAMVMASAQKYRIDPKVLLATMQGESGMGTKGMATSTFNPANIGNETGIRSNNLQSWQNGVDRAALNISERKGNPPSITPNVNEGQNTYGVDLSRITYQPQQPYTAKVQQTSDANHYLYINQSNIPSDYSSAAVAQWAKNNGIVVLSDADAKAVDISSQSQNLLSSPYVQQGLSLLPHQIGPSGPNDFFSNLSSQASLLLQRGKNQIETTLNQTQKGNILNNFNNATGGAIKELQSLTQGATGARFSSVLLQDINSLNPNALSTYEGAQAQLGLIKNIYTELNKIYFAGAKPDLGVFVK